MDPAGDPLCLRQRDVSVEPIPVPCLFTREPQSEQPQILAAESSCAFCPGGEGVLGGGHCWGHHAAGKDTRPGLLCWSRWDSDWEGCTVRPLHLSIPWVPDPERGRLEQSKQCPPGGIAVLSHCPGLSSCRDRALPHCSVSLAVGSHLCRESPSGDPSSHRVASVPRLPVATTAVTSPLL